MKETEPTKELTIETLRAFCATLVGNPLIEIEGDTLVVRGERAYVRNVSRDRINAYYGLAHDAQFTNVQRLPDGASADLTTPIGDVTHVRVHCNKDV